MVPNEEVVKMTIRWVGLGLPEGVAMESDGRVSVIAHHLGVEGATT